MHYKNKYQTHVNVEQYAEDVRGYLKFRLGLNRFQASEILKGSEGIVSANWWNEKSIEETGEEILAKELIFG